MPYGWMGTASSFLAGAETEWLSTMQTNYPAMTQENPSPSQVGAWRDSYTVLHQALTALLERRPDAATWTLLFEYELPREGGRRPDLVILGPDQLLVIEFKQKSAPGPADIDQAGAYARDLSSYHQASHGLPVIAILLPTRATGSAHQMDGVWVVPPTALAQTLADLIPPDRPQTLDPQAWVAAEYAPLPFLVEAARHIFRHDPLPAIKQVHKAQIESVITYLVDVAEQARTRGERHLALITGVPGAGKTLVGLKFVYEHHFGDAAEGGQGAVFLSGNGPLVEVLQYALRSRVFVQPMRNFIKQYGMSRTTPREHVLVFDEAQRAWSQEHVAKKHGHSASEPDMLIGVAERLPGWSMLLGLIGEGQEIHLGEEAGLGQWNEAIQRGKERWHVHAPPALESTFTAAHTVAVNPLLNLTLSLRTHLAEHVQEWVRAVLAGEIPRAQALAPKLREAGFTLYLTRDLDAAKRYVTERYAGEPSKRYGLLASSKAQNLARHGVDNSFQATQALRVGPWYNDPPTSPSSCCQLRSVATEFACQGLELDMPVVCWGNDLWWEGGRWRSRPQPRSEAKDPHQLRLNSYRVLLSRGRDGVVVFVPPELEATAQVLRQAGLVELK